MFLRRIPAWTLIPAGALLLMLAARLWLVSRYGSVAPFWDQWNAEIDGLYRKYMAGSLGFSDFLAAHNEHRIFFTRVLSLLLFVLNQLQFDAKVQMFANVGVHALAFAALLFTVVRAIPRQAALAVAGLFLAATATPIGWENLTWGFQNQFFFMAGVAIAMIWLATHKPMNRSMDVVLVLGSLTSLFTMASGALLPFLLALILLYRGFHEAVPLRWRIHAVIQLLIFIIGMKLMPHVASGDALRAQGALEGFKALRLVLSWPFAPGIAPMLLVNLPVLAGALLLLRAWQIKAPLNHSLLYLVTLGGWCLMQSVASAYSRARSMEFLADVVTTRYTDLLVIGLMANAATAAHLVYTALSNKNTAAFLHVIYPLAFTLGLVCLVPNAFRQIEERHQLNELHRKIMADYVIDHDLAKLEATPGRASFPDAARIAATLDDPVAENLMPATIAGPLPLQWGKCAGFVPSGAYNTVPFAPHSMGSYTTQGDAQLGNCTSTAFSNRRSYLLFRVAGYPDAEGMAIRLVDAEGKARRLSFAQAPRESWVDRIVSAKPGSHLQLDDRNPKTWLAVSGPFEMGRLSAWATLLSARIAIIAGLLAGIGLLLLLAGNTLSYDDKSQQTA